MLTEKSKNLIKEEMLNLPKEAQDAINSSGWEKISEEIGKKYLLDEDEIETFQLETASFLLGLVNEDAYPANIEDEIGTSREEARRISEEVFEKIITPISYHIEVNIKKNLKDKNLNPEQNLNFILSGGDYSAFVAPTTENSPLPPPERLFSRAGNPSPSQTMMERGEGVGVPTPPSLADIENNIQSKFKV